MSASTPSYAPPTIRAITTPLVARAAPSIPCAVALYVPLAQRVLRRSLTHTIFLYTLLYSLCSAVVGYGPFWLDGWRAARAAGAQGVLASFAARGDLAAVLVSKTLRYGPSLLVVGGWWQCGKSWSGARGAKEKAREEGLRVGFQSGVSARARDLCRGWWCARS
ncbi:hypothetical protein C8J57DRAFT_1473092 [Mycena rebaudengoi]|nr:hypothetical protein C8J57DRAFT_1473092 [Mycena rebaudengoi]